MPEVLFLIQYKVRNEQLSVVVDFKIIYNNVGMIVSKNKLGISWEKLRKWRVTYEENWYVDKWW